MILAGDSLLVYPTMHSWLSPVSGQTCAWKRSRRPSKAASHLHDGLFMFDPEQRLKTRSCRPKACVAPVFGYAAVERRAQWLGKPDWRHVLA